jgi:hypothetical protein
MLIKQNYTEIYKAVIHEDSLEIEGEKKHLIMPFRLGDARFLLAGTLWIGNDDASRWAALDPPMMLQYRY